VFVSPLVGLVGMGSCVVGSRVLVMHADIVELHQIRFVRRDESGPWGTDARSSCKGCGQAA
jgi:hypothetical protein